jgi:hypothetical protein
MGCGEVDELAIEDASGVQIHTLVYQLARDDITGTYLLSSEPERSMSPSSDHDRAFTHLVVSLTLAQLHLVMRDKKQGIPSMSIIRSTCSKNLDSVQLTPVHPDIYLSTS